MSRKKNRNKKPVAAHKATPNKATPSKQTQAKKTVHKVRGFWLTFIIVIMALHGIFAAITYDLLRSDSSLSRPWLAGLMTLHALLNIVAAVGIWYWQRWALWVYVVSTIIALVAGLLAYGMWSVFYMILPLAVVGWVIKDKWEYFGIKV
jgi:hypothetical protein